MAPDNEPITKADLNALRVEIKGIRELWDNELRHVKEDTEANTKWRQEFMAEDGPWRKMDQRMQAQETFSEAMKKGAERNSKLLYGVLAALLGWAIIQFITVLPRLAALLGAP